MIPDSVKAIVVKLNPKRAQVRTIEEMGDNDPGTLWNAPYSMISPVVDVSAHTMMVMKSFEQPENKGVKTYMSQVELANIPVEDLSGHDEHIMEAICEIYRIIDDCSGSERYDLSNKINRLFAAFGREVSAEVAAEWKSKKSAMADS